MNNIKELVIALLSASRDTLTQHERGWMHSDAVSDQGFNVLSGESYISFDHAESGSGLYLTVGQAAKIGIDKSNYTIYAGRFVQLIDGLSNHGKFTQKIMQKLQNGEAVTDREVQRAHSLQLGVRTSYTRHYVIDIADIIARGDDLSGQLAQLQERYKLYECDNDLTYSDRATSAGIKIFCGAGRQACNVQNRAGTTNHIILSDIFKSDNALLGTYFHELTHAAAGPSGAKWHKSRGVEEAIAECGAMILQIKNGMTPRISSYCNNWLVDACGDDYDVFKVAEIVAENLQKRINWILDK